MFWVALQFSLLSMKRLGHGSYEELKPVFPPQFDRVAVASGSIEMVDGWANWWPQVL